MSTPDAAVTTPNAGTVSINEMAPTGAPPPNFVLIGKQYTISAPDATAADPFLFVFQVETTEPAESIAVFKDGTEVLACTDAQSSAAAPDPCVLSRVDNGDVVEITVLSSTASVWTFAVPDVVPFDFAGFYAPVNNPPVRNSVQAGRAIPVKFSLGGDQGLDIFAEGYPKSHKIDCDTEDPIDEIESTVTAGASTLTYDADSGRYHYVWKTDKAWDGCRQLELKLTDGTTHKANFDFKEPSESRDPGGEGDPFPAGSSRPDEAWAPRSRATNVPFAVVTHGHSGFLMRCSSYR